MSRKDTYYAEYEDHEWSMHDTTLHFAQQSSSLRDLLKWRGDVARLLAFAHQRAQQGIRPYIGITAELERELFATNGKIAQLEKRKVSRTRAA